MHDETMKKERIIQIKEDDGLSQVICGRCLGTLEFVCDFHKQCHDTQRNLQEEVISAAAAKTEEASNSPEPDAGSDKENATPPQTLRSSTISKKKSPRRSSIVESLNKTEETHGETDRAAINHDNVLADITQDYLELPKTAVAKKLFPNSNGIKRKREIPARKAKEKDNKSIVENSKCKERKLKDSTEIVKKEKQTTSMFKSISTTVIVKQNANTARKGAVPIEQETPMKSNEPVKISNTTELPKPETPTSNLNDKPQDEITLGTSTEAVIASNTPPNPSPPTKLTSVTPTTANKVRRSVINQAHKVVEPLGIPAVNRPSVIKPRRSETFGKISELISEEQKETIERFYTIDMSVIDESIVRKNYSLNDGKKVVCKLCKATYPRVDKCHVHIWGHLDMKPYRCNACDFATVTVTNIRCHIRKSHLKIKPFECNICGKRFVAASLLEEHANTHTGARPYQCEICSFSSHSRQVLVYHNKTHKGVKDVTCDTCKRQFYSKGRLRAHMLIHNKDKTLMCKYCSQHFTSSEALQRHYDNVHSCDYVCTICGKRTKSRKALHNHQNVHSEAKFKCPICPNVYKSSHILKEHLLKHEGIRKYICDVCNKAFGQQSHLAAHKAVHSDKRFFCPGCQRPFNRHDNMKMHTRRCDLFRANEQLQDVDSKHVTSRRSTITDEAMKDNESVMNETEGEKSDKTDVVSSQDNSKEPKIGEVSMSSISEAVESQEQQANGVVTITESIIRLENF